MSDNLLTPFSRSVIARPSYPIPWDTFYEIRDCHGKLVGLAVDEEHADVMVGIAQTDEDAPDIERIARRVRMASADYENAKDELRAAMREAEELL